MFQTNHSPDCDDDGANIALGAGLLLTSKYARIWRRSLYISIFISSKKPASVNHESPPPSPDSSAAYTELPATPPPVVSEPPSRSSSAKSACAIDVHSDDDKEKDVAEELQFRNNIARIVREKDLKLLHELGGIDHIVSVLSRPHSPEEGTVLEATRQVQGTRFLYFLRKGCRRNIYIIILLLISAVLAFATEIKQEGPKYGWHDGVALIVAVILIVGFSSVANFLHERKLLKLWKKKDMEGVTVLRNGNGKTVALSDIVVGDKIYLESGNEVPANGLLISHDVLVLDDALNCETDRERNPFLFPGSKVMEGHGHMLVTSVPDKSNWAEMMIAATHNPEKRRLLDSRIEKPISYIDKLALFVSVLIAFVVLIRLVCKKDGDNNGLPEIKGKVSVAFLREILERIFLRPQGRASILTSVLTVSVLCIQHVMPLTVTISLKYQLDKMAPNQDADLHDLSACGTMGLVDVICIDTASELICRPVEVGRVWMGGKEIVSRDFGLEIDEVIPDLFQQGIGVSLLALELSHNPMSSFLVSWSKRTWKININSFRQNFSILQHKKLNPAREGSGILVRKADDNEQVLHLHWSGAASRLLRMCSHYYDSERKCQAMENWSQFEQIIKDMEESGLRPIAFAYMKTETQELKEDGLCLLALIGLKYSCQEHTKSALKDLQDDGIKIKLVSEDDIMAVRATACDLGISVSAEDGIIKGNQIQDLTGAVRLKKVDLAIVMGNFCPKDKLLVVQCLQEKGHVVAFFGGLTTGNAAVLKEADVAIVGILEPTRNMLRARECSGISIRSLTALVPIVRAGRCEYHNIQKFTQLHLTASISGLLVTLISTMSTGESPLTALQLIWTNILVCLLGGLLMVMELDSNGQLTNEPSDQRKRPLITKEIWKNIVIQVFYQVSMSMIFQFAGHVTDSTKGIRKTMIFNTFILCQVFNQFSAMHILKKEVFKIVLQCYSFLVVLVVCLLMQVLVIQYAKSRVDCMRLSAIQWTVCIFVAALSWGFDGALKSLLVIVSNCSDSITVSSPHGFSSRRFSFFFLYLGIPFLMVLPLVPENSISHYIDHIGRPFR